MEKVTMEEIAGKGFLKNTNLSPVKIFGYNMVVSLSTRVHKLYLFLSPYCRGTEKNVITFAEWYWLMRTFLSHTEDTGDWSPEIKTKESVR